MIPNGSQYGKPGLYRLLDSLVVPVIVALVGVAAFGLGRLSATDSQKGTLIIHPAGEATSTEGTTGQITVH